MQSFVDGVMEPFVKRQPEPENNNGSVKVLSAGLWLADVDLAASLQVVVFDNFDEVVRDPTKDVLITFYQDNCGLCRIFEPKLQRIGDKVLRKILSVCL